MFYDNIRYINNFVLSIVLFVVFRKFCVVLLYVSLWNFGKYKRVKIMLRVRGLVIIFIEKFGRGCFIMKK